MNKFITAKKSRKLNQLWQSKVFRFIIFGGITAVFNVVLLAFIINFLNIKTPFFRNLANVLAIEISLVFSFFIYRTWVWPSKHSTFRETLTRRIPLYHLSVAASIIGRSFLIFPILDWLGVHYVVNTLIGIVLGSVVNYRISDKWVFKVTR